MMSALIAESDLVPLVDLLLSRGMDEGEIADRVRYFMNPAAVRVAMAHQEDARVRNNEYEGMECAHCGREQHALDCALALAWCALDDERGNIECGAWWDFGARTVQPSIDEFAR